MSAAFWFGFAGGFAAAFVISAMFIAVVWWRTPRDCPWLDGDGQ
jgi:hypothetical protein